MVGAGRLCGAARPFAPNRTLRVTSFGIGARGSTNGLPCGPFGPRGGPVSWANAIVEPDRKTRGKISANRRTYVSLTLFKSPTSYQRERGTGVRGEIFVPG